MQEIKLWGIDDNSVAPIKQDILNYEDRLEKWLIDDISILSSNLVVIGSQVITTHGKQIDILAMNSVGELIIFELKRDKTYREVVAQILDYATWVKDLSYEDINSILNKHNLTKYRDISDLFDASFEKEVEGMEFNSDHKMLIVGSSIDDSTIRIIEYLSNEPYSININAVNFNYFKDEGGKEYLAQSFINPEVNLTEESRSKKRNRTKSIVATLFEQEKLKIGQKVYLKPALDQGHDKTNSYAEIVSTGTNCLKWAKDKNTYSFSKLRKVLTKELNLQGVNSGWGYSLKTDWINEEGQSLSQLRDK